MKQYLSLNQNRDFLRLYRRGKSLPKPSVVIYCRRNGLGVCRLGITTSKKIGNAVERNRSRRVIRAAWQQILAKYRLNGSWDFVFVARSKTKFMKSTAVENQLLDGLIFLGVIDEEAPAKSD